MFYLGRPAEAAVRWGKLTKGLRRIGHFGTLCAVSAKEEKVQKCGGFRGTHFVQFIISFDKCERLANEEFHFHIEGVPLVVTIRLWLPELLRGFAIRGPGEVDLAALLRVPFPDLLQQGEDDEKLNNFPMYSSLLKYYNYPDSTVTTTVYQAILSLMYDSRDSK